MAGWQCTPGNTLLIQSGPSNENHLFVITHGPSVIPHFHGYGVNEKVLMVNASTAYSATQPHDPACTLAAGDHPFIRHPSFIYYRHARLYDLTHVVNMVNQGVWTPHTPFSAEMLERIIAGVHSSRHIPREFKTLF